MSIRKTSSTRKRSFAQLQQPRHISKEESLLQQQLFGSFNEPSTKRPKTSEQKLETPKKEAKSAWTDPEDDEITVNVEKIRKLRNLRTSFTESELSGKQFVNRRRKQFSTISDANDWSKHPSSQLTTFQTSMSIISKSKHILSANTIAHSALGSINYQSKHNSIITVCEFHPNGEILMTGGLDKHLSLYSLTDKQTLLKRIFINDLPIHNAKFTADGKEIIITGRRFYFYIFKLMDFELSRVDKILGRDERSWERFYVSPNNKQLVFLGARNNILILSKITKRVIKTMQISFAITDIKFDGNGEQMYVLAENGFIFVFEMSGYECMQCMSCVGIVKAMVFDVCSDLGLFAVGCNSGVVSVYRYGRSGLDVGLMVDGEGKEEVVEMDGHIRVLRSLYDVSNLVNCIRGVQFNHDGQLLCIWSKLKKQALRLVHVCSGRVYSNWPKDRGLQYCYQAKFSPHSGYLAVGNDCGYCHLIRLHFYGQV